MVAATTMIRRIKRHPSHDRFSVCLRLYSATGCDLPPVQLFLAQMVCADFIRDEAPRRSLTDADHITAVVDGRPTGHPRSPPRPPGAELSRRKRPGVAAVTRRFLLIDQTRPHDTSDVARALSLASSISNALELVSSLRR